MSLDRRSFLIGAGATGVASVAGAAVGFKPRSEDKAVGLPDWHAGYRNAPAQGYAPDKLRLVSGRMPTGLSGTLYRNGPAHFTYADSAVGHWFDGDGMIQKLVFEGGQVTHQGRFLDTPKRREEQAHGEIRAMGFGTEAHPDFPIMSSNDTSAANTSVLAVNGETYALWEAGSAVAFNPDTLETRGPKRWSRELAGVGFLAHPKVEPTGRIWNLGFSGQHMVIYDIDARGSLNRYGVVALDQASYLHDFAMTERHLVVMFQPWIYTRNTLPVADALDWQPERGIRIAIIDKATLEVVRWTQAPPRAFFHTGAAWEEADGTIRLDASLYPEPVLGAGGGRAEISGTWSRAVAGPPANVTQIVIPPKGDAHLVETGLDGEFLQVAPAWHGQRRALTVMAETRPGTDHPGASALCLHDWDEGRTQRFDFGGRLIVEEVLFVAKPGAKTERDHWLVGTILDKPTGRSGVAVFDARNVAGGPEALWLADYSWPLGFHGAWV